MRSARLAGAAALAAVLGAAAMPAAAHDGTEHAVITAPLGNLIAPSLGVGENVDYVGGDNGFTGGHVVIEGNRLYLGSYGRGMHIYDISSPASRGGSASTCRAACAPTRRRTRPSWQAPHRGAERHAPHLARTAPSRATRAPTGPSSST